MAENNTADLTEKKLRNLKPFKKGFDSNRNLNGRPKGSVSVVEALKRKLEECPDGNTKTYLELLVARYLKQAIQDGDTQLIKDLIDRVDGKPKQSTDITSNGKDLQQVLVKFINKDEESGN